MVARLSPEEAEEIDVERVLDVRAALIRKKVKSYTAARVLKLLKQILNLAVMAGKLPYNPAAFLG